MEHIGIWVSIFGVIIIPFVGWIFNTLITKKIDDVIDKQKEDKNLFFKRLDDTKEDVEKNYVRKDLYDQAMQFHQKETDSKFNNLVESMNKQFENVEKNIDEVKQLINDKLNGKNKLGT